ncbi:MAG: DUF4159 domain-containing protein [Gemmatimonadetes bacterium]|nr:DUF4159 domain-containing protein [Gemmatimonadota bacterium]
MSSLAAAWRVTLVMVVVAAGVTVSAMQAQERSFRRGREPRPQLDEDYAKYNVPYDGRFTFARLRYDESLWDRAGFWGRRGGDPGWFHDYPRAERHLMKLLSELTFIRPYLDGGNILTADDPELFKYPVAYLSEPGYWTVSDAEATNLRSYLLKGGFLIVDDFEGEHWLNFEDKMRKVLPGAVFVELDPSYPVFHAFFDIVSLENLSLGNYRASRAPSIYYGIFEDNDPKKRLMVVANYNNDIGDYWEWSDMGYFPIELSNEAYKLGINYIIYALTH